MKKFFVLAWLGLLGGQVFAEDLVIAPPNPEFGGCDLSSAGFESKEPFLRVFEQLRTAAAKKDRAALAKLILYPMSVNRSKKVKAIRTPGELKKKFDLVFTPKILGIIEKQKLEQFFCRDQGVMYGNGEVWVGTFEGKVGIKTINSP